jgi:hypothetical protein
MPPEALARQALVDQLLKVMVMSAPNLEPASLQELRAALAGQSRLDLEAWLGTVQADHLIEEAAEMLRSLHRAVRDELLVKRVEAALVPLAVKAQAKRGARHHLDSRRTTIRFRFSKQMPLLELDDRDLQVLVLQAFRLEGMVVALDLGKRPRPLLRSPLPLPAGVAGLDELMDVELKYEAADSEETLLNRLRSRLPEGLAIHRWEMIPNHASGLAERAFAAHWRWCYPPSLGAAARRMADEFLAANEGREGFIQRMAWADDALIFSTRMGSYLATNPLKVLATRLGVTMSELTGLTRLRVDLRPDTRLEQADRFVAKLKNLYEDAVLLGSGSNITLVEDDDDEPIRLG